MGGSWIQDKERRHDPRVRPAGRVRVTPTRSGSAEEGRLVDVSAGGLRLDCLGLHLKAGQAVRLEIHLLDPARPDGPPRLVLDGSGRVVWVHPVEDAVPQAGVEFGRPVDLRAPFPDVQVF